MSERGVTGRIPDVRRRAGWRLCAGLGVALALAPGARAAETITDFQSDVTVEKDGSLHVRETISVVAEQHFIRHGIYRVLPAGAAQGSAAAPLKVVGVQMDGHAEPFEVVTDTDSEKIVIGDKDALLAVGPHSFAIEYTIAGQVALLDDRCALHWSVTGSGWSFPIAHVTATVRLPSSAEVTGFRVFATRIGADAGTASVVSTPGTVTFRTMKELPAGQGFGVEVDFPKGVIDAKQAP